VLDHGFRGSDVILTPDPTGHGEHGLTGLTGLTRWHDSSMEELAATAVVELLAQWPRPGNGARWTSSPVLLAPARIPRLLEGAPGAIQVGSDLFRVERHALQVGSQARKDSTSTPSHAVPSGSTRSPATIVACPPCVR
jgi:hypothetical protein